MGAEIPEADWKILRRLNEVAVERYYQRSIVKMEKLLADRSKAALDRFWAIADLTARDRKEAERLFDDLRRSVALFHLAGLRSHGLLNDEEWSAFTAQTRERVQGLLDGVN